MCFLRSQHRLCLRPTAKPTGANPVPLSRCVGADAGRRLARHLRSMLRQYRRLASGAERQSVGHPRPHGSGRPYACTVPPPGAVPLCGGRPLFAHCGALGALARRLAAAGACRSAAAGAPVLRFASLAARRRRSWAARLPAFLRCGSFLRLGGRLCSGFGGPAAPLWAPGGRRFRPFLALCAVFPPCSLGFSAAAPCRLAAACAAALAFPEVT